MRRNRNHSLVIVILSSVLMLVGCSANRELLETPLPQTYFLPISPDKVWKAVLVEASKPPRRILVGDENAHLCSWINEIEPVEHLHASLTDPEIEGDDESIVIALVRVEAESGGSRLMIRVTYGSAKPFFGISSSRGNYEQEIIRAIRKSLISEVENHGKS